MFDLIYNFLYEFIFANSILNGDVITDTCAIATLLVLFLIIACLIKLVVWAFNIPFNNRKFRG